VKNKKNANKSILAIIAVLSLILVVEGFFILLGSRGDKGPDTDDPAGEMPGEPAEEPPAVDPKDHVKYMHRTESINELKQEITSLK